MGELVIQGAVTMEEPLVVFPRSDFLLIFHISQNGPNLPM